MKHAWYVYILKCSDNSLYTGITTNLTRRVDEHNHNDKLGARYTRGRRPVILAYYEQLADRSQASVRERIIKKMPRMKKEALISGHLPE